MSRTMRSTYITARVTEEQKKALLAAAAKKEWSLSKTLSKAVEKYLEKAS